jgi:hypothetical protein
VLPSGLRGSSALVATALAVALPTVQSNATATAAATFPLIRITQASLKVPVASPNFSILTFARCATVSSTFASGVSLGAEMC